MPDLTAEKNSQKWSSIKYVPDAILRLGTRIMGCRLLMPRRYLTDMEIDQRLQCGRSVEAFLGGAVVEDQRTIRWIELRYNHDRVQGELWEALDPRDPEWLDVYSFGTLNKEDEPSILHQFNSLQDALTELDRQFPGISQRFVNEGVVQEEYADYLANDAQSSAK